MPSLGEYLGGSLQRASARVLPYWLDKKQLERQQEQDLYQRQQGEREYGLQQDTGSRLREALDLQKQEFEYRKNQNRRQEFLDMIKGIEEQRIKGQPKPATTLEAYAIRQAEQGDRSMLDQLLKAKTEKGNKPVKKSVPDMLGRADWLGSQEGLRGAIGTRQNLNTAMNMYDRLGTFRPNPGVRPPEQTSAPSWTNQLREAPIEELRRIHQSIIGQTLGIDEEPINPADTMPAEEITPEEAIEELRRRGVIQ